MIIKVYERVTEADKNKVNAFLTLPFEFRQKSRHKAALDDGTEIGLMLPRGGLLRGGDILRAENNVLIEVVAADESVSTVTHKDPVMLARAAYHLGNRHVPLQVTKEWLRYSHDHVLDDMILGMGLKVVHETAPFEPEGGAYGGDNYHEHKHDHSH